VLPAAIPAHQGPSALSAYQVTFSKRQLALAAATVHRLTSKVNIAQNSVIALMVNIIRVIKRVWRATQGVHCAIYSTVDAMSVKKHITYWLDIVISGVVCSTPAVRGTGVPGAMKTNSVLSASLVWFRARVTQRLAFSSKLNAITLWAQSRILNGSSCACKNHTVRNVWCQSMKLVALMWTGDHGALSDHPKTRASAVVISHSVRQHQLKVNSRLKLENCTIYLSNTYLIVIR